MIANICGSIFFISLGGVIGALLTVWIYGVKEVIEDKHNSQLALWMIIFGCGMFWAATKLGLIW